MDDEVINIWYPYEGGASVGRTGFEGGLIVRDEELGDPDETEDADARLTMERGDTGLDSRIITATLYGWLSETRGYRTQAEAEAVWERIQPALAHLATLIPDEESRDIARKVAALNAVIAEFTREFFGV